jgi:hypothetical protein
MRRLHRLLVALLLGFVMQQSSPAYAGSQDDHLRQVHSALWVTGAHIQWVPNGFGGLTPTLVYDITNVTNASILVPVTVRAGIAGNWAGVRQHWIERLGRDPTISAIPRTTARRGRQYAYGGSTIQWPGQAIAPSGFLRFREPISIGGFPSGRYALTIEYETSHEQRLVRFQTVYFNVP